MTKFVFLLQMLLLLQVATAALSSIETVYYDIFTPQLLLISGQDGAGITENEGKNFMTLSI